MKDGERKSRGRRSEDASILEMQGLFTRNLKCRIRAFAVASPDGIIVQQLAAQILWFHNCTLLDMFNRVDDLIAEAVRLAAAVMKNFNKEFRA